MIPPQDIQEDLAHRIASVPGSDRQLAPLPADRLHLRMANFGMVTHADTDTLSRAVEREVAQQPRMQLRFSGGAVLEPIGDDSIWARLEGDVDQFAETADLIVRVVKRLGFLIDRRLPRTLVRLGRITPTTTTDFLQRVTDQLDGYSSREWICEDVVLLRMSESGQEAGTRFEVLNRFPLQTDDATDVGKHRGTSSD